MKHKLILAASLGLIPLLLSAKTVNNPLPRLLIDRIATIAKVESKSGTAALKLLEEVALGQMYDIDPESLTKIGVEVGPPQQKAAFRDSSIRVYTFNKIGGIDMDESLDFLTNLKHKDVGPDTTGSIWPAAQIALASARLNRIIEPQSKIDFLEGLLNPRVPASSWAMNQLCDRGSSLSMRVIRPYITLVWTDQYGGEDLQFCEARMHIVNRNPDRVKALGSVLSVDSDPNSDRLVRWAMDQLGEMESPAAYGELMRFKMEMKVIPSEDLRQGRFSNLSQVIDYYLERNLQKEKTSPISRQPKR